MTYTLIRQHAVTMDLLVESRLIGVENFMSLLRQHVIPDPLLESCSLFCNECLIVDRLLRYDVCDSSHTDPVLLLESFDPVSRALESRDPDLLCSEGRPLGDVSASESCMRA